MSKTTDDVQTVEKLGEARDGVVKELRSRGYSLITDTSTPTCWNAPECSSPEFSDGDLDL